MRQEHMSAAELRAHLAGGATSSGQHYARGGKGKRPGPARRTRHVVGQMNKLESDYLRTMLEPRKASGEVSEIKFEAVKLRLADNTFYTPDFSVAADCLEIHEVKGHWEDDARVKWKVASEMYPEYRFFAATRRKKKNGGGWEIEEYGKREETTQGRLA